MTLFNLYIEYLTIKSTNHDFSRQLIRLISNIQYSYTMGCPPVGGDNSQALCEPRITILYHLHQCRPCTSRNILHAKFGKRDIRHDIPCERSITSTVAQLVELRLDLESKGR